MMEKNLVAVAAFLCDCLVSELLKVRGDGAGGLVVIVSPGPKHVFSVEQVGAAFARMAEEERLKAESESKPRPRVAYEIEFKARDEEKLLTDEDAAVRFRADEEAAVRLRTTKPSSIEKPKPIRPISKAP